MMDGRAVREPNVARPADSRLRAKTQHVDAVAKVVDDGPAVVRVLVDQNHPCPPTPGLGDDAIKEPGERRRASQGRNDQVDS